MKDHFSREKQLNQLMRDNFSISRFCRKVAEHFTDPSLEYYFQTLASRRSQFAAECMDAIRYYGGKETPDPRSLYDERKNMQSNLSVGDGKLFKKCISVHRQSLVRYREALAAIYDGACREMLIRHKAFVEQCIFELKALKKLIKYQVDQQTKAGSHKEEEQV